MTAARSACSWARGTFGPAQNYAVGGHPSSFAVGDFNNDGKLDIVTANNASAYGSPSTVSVLLGKGDGTFQPALNYSLPTEAGATQIPQSVAVGDFNKDGKLDVAVTGYTLFASYNNAYLSAYVNVLIGNGAGGFTAVNSYNLAAGWVGLSSSLISSVAVGDFRGNGNLDLVIAETDIDSSYGVATIPTVSVLLGNGKGTFGYGTDLAIGPGSRPDSVAVGDFDGDKTLDIVTANQNGGVSVFLGKGDGTFGTPVNYSTGLNF
jgi:hypothetical protein